MSVRRVAVPLRGIVSPPRDIVLSMRDIISPVRRVILSMRDFVLPVRRASVRVRGGVDALRDVAVHVSGAFSPPDVLFHRGAGVFFAGRQWPVHASEALSSSNMFKTRRNGHSQGS